MKQNKGFSLIEGILVLVVIAIVGLVGYLAYTNFIAPDDESVTSSNTTQQQEEAEPVVVESSEDIDSAIKALDDISIEDESDSASYDSVTKDFES